MHLMLPILYAAAQKSSPLGLLFPVLLIGAFYFLLIRPQRQRVSKQAQLVRSIEVGDTVITAGGVVGEVTWLDDEEAVLSIAPNGVLLTFARRAITNRVAHDGDDTDGGDGDGNSHTGGGER